MKKKEAEKKFCKEKREMNIKKKESAALSIQNRARVLIAKRAVTTIKLLIIQMKAAVKVRKTKA